VCNEISVGLAEQELRRHEASMHGTYYVTEADSKTEEKEAAVVKGNFFESHCFVHEQPERPHTAVQDDG